MITSSTRIALLTPPGRGALAVVAARGPGAVGLVERLFWPRGGPPLTARPDGSIVFGRWGDPERGEELVVVRHAADQVEVHCHGGLAASAAVMASLTSLNARPAASFSLPVAESRTVFSLSQTTNSPAPTASPAAGHSPPAADLAPSASAPAVARRLTIDREAREALARVASPRAAQILCRQLAGALADELDRIDARRAAGDLAAATAAIDRLRQAARVGLRLVDPWRVVLSGPVNAGKSSLVNALAGYARSIVSAEPGTTRDVVATRLVLDGWEIDLIDTAGLREAATATERAGIERAAAAAATADLILKVGQASACHPAAVHQNRGATSVPVARQAEAYPTFQTRQAEACPTLRILSQCDLTPGLDAPPGVLLTSALTGEGIDALARSIVAAVVPEAAAAPALLAGPVPFTPRHLAELAKVGQASACQK
jgi:tRNA modification GTPase